MGSSRRGLRVELREAQREAPGAVGDAVRARAETVAPVRPRGGAPRRGRHGSGPRRGGGAPRRGARFAPLGVLERDAEVHDAAHGDVRPQALGPGARAEHDRAARDRAVGGLEPARGRGRDGGAPHPLAELPPQPRDRGGGADRAAARIPQQRPGVRRQRRVEIPCVLERGRRHAGGPQPGGVAGHIPAQPQRALRPHERLPRAHRPAVPQRAGADRVGDLLRRRVQVAEAARGAGGLPGPRHASLQHDDVGAAPGERVRHGEADDPATRDGDVRRARHARARYLRAGAGCATPRTPRPARARRRCCRTARTSAAGRTT